MQAFLIILIVVFAFILLGVNFYLLQLYIHRDDKSPIKSIFQKITIVLGLTICQAQALMIPLDVTNKSAILTDTLNMSLFWIILYSVLLGFICVLIPIAIFYYQSDPQQNFMRRVLRTLGYWFVTVIVSAMILFISWNFLKYVDVPVTELAIDAQYYDDFEVEHQVTTQKYVQIQASIPVYFIGLLSFIGWFLVICFGGVGLFSLPMDLINQFRHRPKVRKSQQMKTTKNNLVRAIRQLIQQGQNITDKQLKRQRNDQAGCLQRFKGSRSSNSMFTKFKIKYHLLHQQFTVFNLQLKLADVNPIIPIFKLILGIIFIITSLLWLIQIIFGNIAQDYKLSDRPLVPVLNDILIFMDKKNVGLVAMVIFAYFCLYMMWCVQKGSIKMGMRIPFICRFYPLSQNQTAINGFLVNVLFIMLASVGVTQLCISSFPTYTRNAQIYTIFGVEIKNMRFYYYFYRYNIFPIALVCWTFLGLLYLLVTCNRKPQYMRDIQEIREMHEEEIDRLK